MTKPRICIDIDNVVASTDDVIRTIIADFTAGRVQLNRSDIQEFNYWECRDRGGEQLSRDEWDHVHDEFSTRERLFQVAPFEDIQNHLAGLAERYQLVLATTRLRAARLFTVEWLESHSFPEHDLHFVQHGQKHKSVGRCEFAVEDHYEQAAKFAESGVPCFLIRHPWNETKPKADRLTWVESWEEIVTRLL